MISLALQLLQMNINVVLDFGCWGRDSRTALPCVTDRAAPADCARRSAFPGATTFTERFACGAGVDAYADADGDVVDMAVNWRDGGSGRDRQPRPAVKSKPG